MESIIFNSLGPVFAYGTYNNSSSILVSDGLELENITKQDIFNKT